MHWIFFLGLQSLQDLFLINPIRPIWPTHPDWNPGGWKDGAAMLVQMENQSWEGAEDVAENDFDDEDILSNVKSEAENDKKEMILSWVDESEPEKYESEHPAEVLLSSLNIKSQHTALLNVLLDW